MSKKQDYIKLPTIKFIEISNYSLFKKGWSYKVKNGLNLFLGANTLGKTTTVFMIIYGIVGLWEDITKTYFKDREHPSLKPNNNNGIPSIKILFKIANESISITRRLDKPEILTFSIGKRAYSKDSSNNIKDVYNETVTKLFGLEDIDDMSFLLRKLLIREEEGNYLLWNKLDQSKVIRLLFNYSQFYKEFRQIAKEVTNYDTKVRGDQDIQFQFKRSMAKLIKEKEKEIRKGKAIKSLAELKAKIRDIKKSIESLNKRNENLFNDLSYLKNELDSFDQKIDTISSEIDLDNDEIIGFENKFFESVYLNPKLSLSVHKLTNYQICIFCNKTIAKDKADEIDKTIHHLKHCPVCDSGIGISPKQRVKPTAELIKRIEILKKGLVDKNRHLKNLVSKRESIKRSFDDLLAKQKKNEVNLRAKNLDLFDLRFNLAKFEKDEKLQITKFDRPIEALQMEINKYQKIIDKNKRVYDKKLAELNNKNNELNNKIDKFNSKLNEIFNNYSSKYFRRDCKLVPRAGRRPSGSKINLTTFCPAFDQKIRPYQNSVSKSEGIFLEYLFRMSLIELYSSITSQSPFFIVETSEGTFDVFATERLAELVGKFGKNKFPFIAITNLSKPEFIKQVVRGQKDIRERIVNFIDFGVFSEEAEGNKKDFNNTLKKLKLI